MRKQYITFIVNPHSGKGNKAGREQLILRSVDRAQYDAEIVYTRYKHHGSELAREAASKGADIVAAVGGDGSVGDVAHGLAGSGVTMGIIPDGSGNGLARALGIPLDLRRSVELLAVGRTVAIDIGYANERVFVSNSGVGFDAFIVHQFAKHRERGFKKYVWLTLKYLWRYQPWEFTFSIDGKHFTKRAFMAVVANGRQFGYGFKIAPSASLDDGLADIMIIGDFPGYAGPGVVWSGFNGSMHRNRHVSHLRTAALTISHPDLTFFQADGDGYPCQGSVTYRMVKQAQRVLLPK